MGYFRNFPKYTVLPPFKIFSCFLPFENLSLGVCFIHLNKKKHTYHYSVCQRTDAMATAPRKRLLEALGPGCSPRPAGLPGRAPPLRGEPRGGRAAWRRQAARHTRARPRGLDTGSAGVTGGECRPLLVASTCRIGLRSGSGKSKSQTTGPDGHVSSSAIKAEARPHRAPRGGRGG